MTRPPARAAFRVAGKVWTRGQALDRCPLAALQVRWWGETQSLAPGQRPGRPNVPCPRRIASPKRRSVMGQEMGGRPTSRMPRERLATILLPNSVAQDGMRQHSQRSHWRFCPCMQDFLVLARTERNGNYPIKKWAALATRQPKRMPARACGRNAHRPVRYWHWPGGWCVFLAGEGLGSGLCLRISLRPNAVLGFSAFADLRTNW